MIVLDRRRTDASPFTLADALQGTEIDGSAESRLGIKR